MDPCLPHTPWRMLSTIHGEVALPTSSSSLRDWTMRSSTSLTSYLPLLFRHMLNLFFFCSFPLPCLSWFIMVENCNRKSLLPVSSLTLHISFGQSTLMALMALLGSVSCPVIPILWATLFLQTLGRWVFLLLYSFCYLSFFWSLAFLSLNCSLPSKSMRSWYRWLGISS